MNEIQVKVSDIVLRPAETVFEAIANADKLSGYFISSASDSLREGESITWYFDDVGGELNISVHRVIPCSFISFDWAASGSVTCVQIAIEQLGPDKTSVLITEDKFPMDAEGVKRALGQTQGWTDFLCSLKAFLYCGINLRDGRNG